MHRDSGLKEQSYRTDHQNTGVKIAGIKRAGMEERRTGHSLEVRREAKEQVRGIPMTRMDNR